MAFQKILWHSILQLHIFRLLILVGLSGNWSQWYVLFAFYILKAKYWIDLHRGVRKLADVLNRQYYFVCSSTYHLKSGNCIVSPWHTQSLIMNMHQTQIFLFYIRDNHSESKTSAAETMNITPWIPWILLDYLLYWTCTYQSMARWGTKKNQLKTEQKWTPTQIYTAFILKCWLIGCWFFA